MIKFCACYKITLYDDYLFSLSIFCSLETLSQDWLPTVQLVLQADWQVLLHSPQPVVHLSTGFAIVLIMIFNLLMGFIYSFPYYNTVFCKNQAFFRLFTDIYGKNPAESADDGAKEQFQEKKRGKILHAAEEEEQKISDEHEKKADEAPLEKSLLPPDAEKTAQKQRRRLDDLIDGENDGRGQRKQLYDEGKEKNAQKRRRRGAEHALADVPNKFTF